MRKILVVLCLSLFACDLNDDNNELVCTEELRPGLIVSVRNALDNTTLDNAVVTAKDGDFEEVLEEFTSNSSTIYTGVFERMGIYILTVERDGFQTFTSDPIQVSADICHVITQEIIINLQPN